MRGLRIEGEPNTADFKFEWTTIVRVLDGCQNIPASSTKLSPRLSIDLINLYRVVDPPKLSLPLEVERMLAVNIKQWLNIVVQTDDAGIVV